ncbi:uncharacterized protein JCM6883_005456 [Sporobolomyces salmoneus]|uniref:uncharacterized protein n=1 Tax=Sporobolomyces salmoneus TaxID=183962 RepID=UPI003180443A
MDRPLYDYDHDQNSFIAEPIYNDPYSTPYSYSEGPQLSYGHQFPLDYDYDSRELPGAYSYDEGDLYDDRGYAVDERVWDDGRFDLEEYTNWIDREVPIYDAWGDERWDEQQYAMADLLYFQQQLELDHTLDEIERMRRWEERLEWEELEEEERLRQYQLSDLNRLSRLGLDNGFWSRRFGGRQVDLSHLRSVPIRRGLFSTPYRSSFVRHPTLGRRYQPYFSRSALRAYRPSRIQPSSSASYGNYPRHDHSAYAISTDLRNQDLISRLRIADLRASLASISPTDRALALEESRRIRQVLHTDQIPIPTSSDYSRERTRGAMFREEELRRERDEIRRDWESRRRVERVENELESERRRRF